MEPNGADISLYYEVAPETPPLTLESLAELDMSRIINNPKLRHDVNFDRELHFRPNLDGSKGREKLQAADQYWLALEGELFMYRFAAERKAQSSDPTQKTYWNRIHQGTQRRLRQVFETVRDILQTLVPDHEQKRVAARLDVDLIMQEIMNGVCDLIDLSSWLAKVLKAHCAPMRDGLVDAMQAAIECGTLEGRNDKLVSGLRQLLAILEAMKLDVANHQIRHMRPLLIDDTVNFQRKYNAHRVASGKVNVSRCQQWLQNEIELLGSRGSEEAKPTPLTALTSALLADILFNEAHSFPQTFYLDHERLRVIRTDVRSIICHALCREFLAELTPAWVSRTELLKAQALLQCAVSAVVGMSGRFAERVENIAVEIVRVLLVLQGRYPPFDSTLLTMVEQKLRQKFQPVSAAFDELAKSTRLRLLPKLIASIEMHLRMSALELQDALVASPVHHRLPPPPFGMGAVCAPATPAKQYDPDEDIVRRLTHVVCLHWHVWADIVYLAHHEYPDDLDYDSISRTSSPTLVSASSSPTIPVAQAVYAPGRKWLPDGVTVTEVPNSRPPISSTFEPAVLPEPGCTKGEESDEQPEQDPYDAQQQQPA
ncbi:hypothetical protein BAUCODRAFT_68916 [Baudoinia panamericana UAMH 10762]|uniref:Uncharacterized protein n=1 Tax=Baudoinia panamericana (strain UAMH 10762) TaxID=717646 RepID=M2NEU4_BAUPA|nr:uncharacterized protein BAUCODRAFT_68916 [Baudoinia panamericana UAMH 10762]EMC97485.1 hypothetical protein BAUCODRAFT_68916 [Baudoinia panamericana UAMH 10762]